jgi:hypothetical protein
MIPKAMAFEGNFIEGARWKDSAGVHYIITSEKIKPSKDPENGEDAEVHAYHYLQDKTDSPKIVWKVYDYEKDCPVDLKASFIKNTFSITDLDKNGLPEVWMMYKTYCRGDISPSIMKIIVYESNKKYAIRGRTKVQLSQKDYDGGEYSFDESFKKAPTSFKEYGKKLWAKNIKETWE